MDIFKASNSNELANLSQSPVNQIVRRPLTTIDEDSPIHKTTNKIQWDTRSTPIRTKNEHNLKRERSEKESKPKVVKNFKRYKSSPQLTNRNNDDDPEEREKRMEHFRNLIMGGISSVKPRNLMENLDKSLNDSIVDEPLVGEENAIKKMPSDDLGIHFEDLDRIEAEENAKNKKKNLSDAKKSEDDKSKAKAEESLTDDDFGIDFADLERIEAEAMEKLKKEEEQKENCDDLLIVDSLFDWNAKPIACSTQFTQLSKVKPEGPSKASKGNTVKQVEPRKNPVKFPPVFNTYRPENSKEIQPKKPSSVSNQPSSSSTLQPSKSSTSQPCKLSDADKLRIERNRQEAMRRRQIFLENAKKRKS